MSFIFGAVWGFAADAQGASRGLSCGGRRRVCTSVRVVCGGGWCALVLWLGWLGSSMSAFSTRPRLLPRRLLSPSPNTTQPNQQPFVCSLHPPSTTRVNIAAHGLIHKDQGFPPRDVHTPPRLPPSPPLHLCSLSSAIHPPHPPTHPPTHSTHTRPLHPRSRSRSRKRRRRERQHTTMHCGSKSSSTHPPTHLLLPPGRKPLDTHPPTHPPYPYTVSGEVCEEPVLARPSGVVYEKVRASLFLFSFFL